MVRGDPIELEAVLGCLLDDDTAAAAAALASRKPPLALLRNLRRLLARSGLDTATAISVQERIADLDAAYGGMERLFSTP